MVQGVWGEKRRAVDVEQVPHEQHMDAWTTSEKAQERREKVPHGKRATVSQSGGHPKIQRHILPLLREERVVLQRQAVEEIRLPEGMELLPGEEGIRGLPPGAAL